MLGKRGKKIDVDEMVIAKVNQDLIVHNMPNHFQAGMASAPRAISKSQFLSATDKKNNFKMVGGLIVGLGIVFVGTLIYLSYYFIIKPRMTSPTATLPPVVIDDQKILLEASEKVIIETAVVSTTTSIIETDPLVLDIINDPESFSTSSSTELANLNEEIISRPPLIDTDADGLNDDEELVLGTNPMEADSDKDGYGDLSEIANGYSPREVNKKLYPNEMSAKYDNKPGKYTVYYPSAWGLKTLNNDYTAVISASDDSLIQISVQDNPNIQSILTWYEVTFPGETVAGNRLQDGDSWEGVMGADGLNFYLTDKERENIYVISYISSDNERLVYPNIFQMIIDSFQIN